MTSGEVGEARTVPALLENCRPPWCASCSSSHPLDEETLAAALGCRLLALNSCAGPVGAPERQMTMNALNLRKQKASRRGLLMAGVASVAMTLGVGCTAGVYSEPAVTSAGPV